MKKKEFMDLLNYYFRKSDKNDLKGIIEDCEEQFRLGAKQGKSEEEICCKLGHPKNIYRYYIGEPIVPEDNPRLPGEESDYEDFGPGQEDTAPEEDDAPAYETPRQHQDDLRYDRQQARQARYNQEAQQTGKDFDWDDDEPVGKAARAVANPFLDILGTFFSIIGGLLYVALILAIAAAVGISFIPPYAITDLLPLPTISIMTRVLVVLTILFAAMTATYAGEACHRSSRKGAHA